MLPAILGGLASGAMSSIGNIFGTKYAHDLNRSSAREAFDWQKGEADTAVQRHVKDLEAAGLNPILAANPGGQASTPMATAANAQAPDMEFSGLISNVSQLATLRSSLGKLDAETKESIARADKTAAETPNNAHVRELMESTAALNRYNANARSTDELIAKLLSRVVGHYFPAPKATAPDPLVTKTQSMLDGVFPSGWRGDVRALFQKP